MAEESGERQRVRGFSDLEVFQRALGLVRPVHDLANRLPDYEKFDLAQQMRRASKSVPTNIAEGFGRQLSPKDYRLYLGHAIGSANEMIAHLLIAIELEYAPVDAVSPLRDGYEIVARQLNRLIRSWR